MTMLTEEQLDQMTLREIAAASPWGWLSPAIWTRGAFPAVVKVLPLPKAVKQRMFVVRKVSKWPTPQERFRQMVEEMRDGDKTASPG